MTTITVSVLNASYEPLGSTKLGRAMALILKGDAVVEEADPARKIRHQKGWEPWPIVIRMLRYIKVPVRYAPAMWSKSGVLRRDNYQCGYCTKRHGTTVDHILPVSRDGKNSWENTISCCQPCNSKKDNRTPDEANMPLLFEPTVPMRIYISSKNK